jgi:hypothetical protein
MIFAVTGISKIKSTAKSNDNIRSAKEGNVFSFFKDPNAFAGVNNNCIILFIL